MIGADGAMDDAAAMQMPKRPGQRTGDGEPLPERGQRPAPNARLEGFAVVEWRHGIEPALPPCPRRDGFRDHRMGDPEGDPGRLYESRLPLGLVRARTREFQRDGPFRTLVRRAENPVALRLRQNRVEPIAVDRLSGFGRRREGRIGKAAQ